jgi:outer membrane protein assembly factor BamB
MPLPALLPRLPRRTPRRTVPRWLPACLALGLLPPTQAPAAASWPQFRGPAGQGHAGAASLPLEWDTDRNVRWKTPVAGHGWSSPVVGHGLVFLTTGVPAAEGPPALHALAFDLATGALRWNTEVFAAAENSAQPIHKKNSPASPTPLIEGGRVYVHFGHHGTACLDLDGRPVWRNRDLGYHPVHGNGGSPILAGDHLIFTADGARDPAVIALDKHTGRLAWKTPRGVTVKQPFSFATPLLIEVDGRPQVIAPGSGAVMAYDPRDGRELWRVRYGNGYSVIPRPVFAHGLLFLATGFGKPDLLAIRPGGSGDVTDTHIVWRTSKNAPLTPSLLVVGDELYAVSDTGIATCFAARTGQVHWEERVEGNHSASPLAAEGRIYFQNETGTATVLRAGREFAKLATNKLGERTFASYAVAGDTFLIRTERHLYRIGGGG